MRQGGGWGGQGGKGRQSGRLRAGSAPQGQHALPMDPEQSSDLLGSGTQRQGGSQSERGAGAARPQRALKPEEREARRVFDEHLAASLPGAHSIPPAFQSYASKDGSSPDPYTPSTGMQAWLAVAPHFT